jgi:hypothetical protein
MPFNVSAAAVHEMPQNQGPKLRREMRGPTNSGVDDILKAFEAERQQQQQPNVAAHHASIFTPSGPPPTPPRGVSIVREGLGSSSDPLNEFSIGDSQSEGTEGTMNTERRRGRRRAVVAPVGSTLNLNV